jgi:hypothetical protein
MNNRTQLVSGEVITGHVLAVWLVKPAGGPERVVIEWPSKSTAVSPRKFSDVCAVACRLLANASTELAAIKAGKRV